MKTVTLVLAGLLCVSTGAEAGFVTYRFETTVDANPFGGSGQQLLKAIYTYDETDPPSSSYLLVSAPDQAPSFSFGDQQVSAASGTLDLTAGESGENDLYEVNFTELTGTVFGNAAQFFTISIAGIDLLDDNGLPQLSNFAAGQASVWIIFVPGENGMVTGPLSPLTVDDFTLTRTDPVAPEPASLALLMIGMLGVGAPAARRQLGRWRC